MIILVLVVICTLGILGMLVSVCLCICIGCGNVSQKHRRAKRRAMADGIIGGQTDAGTKQINKLIDELLRLNNLLIGKSEEDRVRVEQLRRIRDGRGKNGQRES